jgi:hypothetical protein
VPEATTLTFTAAKDLAAVFRSLSRRVEQLGALERGPLVGPGGSEEEFP